jgi:hypothetical protein
MVTTKRFEEHEIPAHIAVVQGTYDRPEITDETHLRWKHLDAPFGASDAITLPDTKVAGRLHGRSFIMPRSFVLNTRETVRGATIADLVLHADSRNAGRLIALVKATKQLENYDIVLHSSNEVSDIFYRNMFKFPVYFSLASAGFPVRLKNYLESSGKSTFLASLANTALFPARLAMPIMRGVSGLLFGIRFGDAPSREDLDRIHTAHHARTGPQFERSSDYVEWRYRTGPISRSDVIGLYGRDGVSMGYAAVRSVDVDGIQFCVLMDLITDKILTAGQVMALKFALIDHTRKAGNDIAFSMFNPNHAELAPLAAFPFVTVPDSALPHPSPVFIHKMDGQIDADAARTVYFMVGDLDYF